MFKVLREKWDTNFDSFISAKVAAISGDVSFENLDLKDAQLRELLWKEIDVIIHSAATTNFDERYYYFMDLLNHIHLTVINYRKYVLILNYWNRNINNIYIFYADTTFHWAPTPWEFFMCSALQKNVLNYKYLFMCLQVSLIYIWKYFVEKERKELNSSFYSE